MLLNEGVVCERNFPPAHPGLSTLQNELADRLQVGKSVGKIKEKLKSPSTQVHFTGAQQL